MSGATAVLLGSLLLTRSRLRTGERRTFVILVAVAAFLTGLASWFLMQNALTITMAVAFIAHLITWRPNASRRAEFGQ